MGCRTGPKLVNLYKKNGRGQIARYSNLAEGPCLTSSVLSRIQIRSLAYLGLEAKVSPTLPPGKHKVDTAEQLRQERPSIRLRQQGSILDVTSAAIGIIPGIKFVGVCSILLGYLDICTTVNS